jgi:hypothetical protein
MKNTYIFMTDDEQYVDGTWEPFGGENAVIVQPGDTTDVPFEVELVSKATRSAERLDSSKLTSSPIRLFRISYWSWIRIPVPVFSLRSMD